MSPKDRKLVNTSEIRPEIQKSLEQQERLCLAKPTVSERSFRRGTRVCESTQTAESSLGVTLPQKELWWTRDLIFPSTLTKFDHISAVFLKLTWKIISRENHQKWPLLNFSPWYWKWGLGVILDLIKKIYNHISCTIYKAGLIING